MLVFAPDVERAWSLIVAFHGVGGTPEDMAEIATGLGQQGNVVFARPTEPTSRLRRASTRQAWMPDVVIASPAASRPIPGGPHAAGERCRGLGREVDLLDQVGREVVGEEDRPDSAGAGLRVVIREPAHEESVPRPKRAARSQALQIPEPHQPVPSISARVHWDREADPVPPSHCVRGRGAGDPWCPSRLRALHMRSTSAGRPSETVTFAGNYPTSAGVAWRWTHRR